MKRCILTCGKIDPHKLQNKDELEQNIANLKAVCQFVINRLCETYQQLPV